MAPVIWGLDLKEMQWWKFKSSYMFKNRDYHLRRTKFCVYQCALIFCVVSESLGTAALSDYIDAQKFVARRDPNVYVFNNDYIGAASYNIFAGIFVAFIFGGAFFFDLFWPAREESKSVRIAWKTCGILAVLFYTANAFTLTVITALHCQYFRGEGVTEAHGNSLLSQFKKDGGTPQCYRDDGRALAAVVFVWPGLLSVVGSCILLFLSIDHTEKGPGPYSHRAREQYNVEAEAESEKEKDNAEDSPAIQAQHQTAGDETSVGAVSMAAHHTNPVHTDASAAGQSHFQHAGG